MSSAVVSTSAAPGRPFLFDAGAEPVMSSSLTANQVPDVNFHVGTAALGCPVEQSSTGRQHLQSTINNQKFSPASITPASRLELRPAPEMVTSGIPALDALTGGLPRGCLTEICGPASSGRTSVMLAALASATRRGEYCAVIDASDAFDPHSLAATGIDLDRLLWVRCDENSPRRHPSASLSRKSRLPADPARSGAPSFICFGGPNSAEVSRNRKHSEHRIEQVLRATDLLLESGGFGLIILDLADIPEQAARRIPLTTWFRFRRAVEHKPTILLAIEQQPIAGSCSSLLLQLKVLGSRFAVLSSNQFSKGPATRDGRLSHAHLFTELEIHAELIRSRLDRKPARSITFETKSAWAG